MATFRSSAAVAIAIVSLACSPPSAQEAGAPVAPIVRDEIDDVAPKRDAVGPMPARFEWTAAQGVDEYAITVENEVDVRLFQARSRATSVVWPRGDTLEPGTCFWRVVGLAADGRRVADSGRAAFVVAE